MYTPIEAFEKGLSLCTVITLILTKRLSTSSISCPSVSKHINPKYILDHSYKVTLAFRLSSLSPPYLG